MKHMMSITQAVTASSTGTPIAAGRLAFAAVLTDSSATPRGDRVLGGLPSVVC